MKTYSCPHCGHHLSSEDGTEINFRCVLDGPRFRAAVPLVLSAELGNYARRIEGDVTLEDGAKPDFACPACKQSFTCTWNEELAEIRMEDPELEGQNTVVFSRVYGTRATFVYDRQRQLLASFGQDKEAYVAEFGKLHNFFGS